MRLSNAYLKVRGTDITANLTSLDCHWMTEPSRSNWNRKGKFINESIDAIEINFKRDDVPSLRDKGLQDEIVLTYSDGVKKVTGTFVVEQKINTKDVDGTTNTYMSFIPKSTFKGPDGQIEDQEFRVEAEGGSAPVGSVEWGYIEGDIINQTDLTDELAKKFDKPAEPRNNGTYVLKATKTDSGITYEWVPYTLN